MRLIKQLYDSLCQRVAWCLPARVVYWAAIRLGVYATTGKYQNTIVTNLTFLTALKYWGEDQLGH